MANGSQLAAASIGGVSTLMLSSNVTMERTMLDITALGDAWQTNLYGVGRISGSVDVAYNKIIHANALGNIAGAGAAVAAIFTWKTGETWTGNVRVNSVNVTAAADDLVRATISFVGEGAWSI